MNLKNIILAILLGGVIFTSAASNSVISPVTGPTYDRSHATYNVWGHWYTDYEAAYQAACADIYPFWIVDAC